jgi:hypothetical protein
MNATDSQLLPNENSEQSGLAIAHANRFYPVGQPNSRLIQLVGNCCAATSIWAICGGQEATWRRKSTIGAPLPRLTSLHSTALGLNGRRVPPHGCPARVFDVQSDPSAHLID